MEATTLGLSYTPSYKEIRSSAEIKALPSAALPQTLYLASFLL